MDVVEFVEQVLGLHLMDYQKEFLIKVYGRLYLMLKQKDY